MTDYYEDSGSPSTGSNLSSATMRAEFQLIEAGFAKIAQYTSNGSKIVGINAAGTGQEALTSVAVAQGGTGSTTASGARTNLGVAIGSDVQAFDAGLASIAGLTTVADSMIYATASDTYAVTTLSAFARTLLDDAAASNARTTLGLGTIATQNSSGVAITGGTITGITDLAVADGGTGASDASTARTNLGLGSLATASTINNSNWSGTDLAVANGGTGASDAGTARTNLGVAIGSDVQAFDAGLASIAGLTTAADRMIYTTASDTYAVATLTSFARTLLDDTAASTARTTLGLGSLATASTINNDNWSGTDLAVTNGGTGASDAGTARTNLGLGSLATLSSINNSNWSGTDLAITNGGTGASDAGTARTNLGLGSLATLSSINNSNWSGTDLAVANGGTGVSSLSSLNLSDFNNDLDAGDFAAPSVSSYTGGNIFYIRNIGDSSSFQYTVSLSSATQTSIGPTGSGATYTSWTALNNAISSHPNAKGIILGFSYQYQPNTAGVYSDYCLRAARGGETLSTLSSPSSSGGQVIAGRASYPSASAVIDRQDHIFVALDDNGVFELLWATNNVNTSTHAGRIYLIGVIV